MEEFVGRGNDVVKYRELGINPKTKKDMRKHKSDTYPEADVEIDKSRKYPPKKDKYNNEESSHGEYGSVEIEDRSWFCTDDVVPEKLGKILTAFQNGILVKHDPKKEYGQIAINKQKKNFAIQPDGDIVFTGTNEFIYNMLNNHGMKKIREYVMNAGRSARQNLMDLYQYELKGYNSIARPRAELLDVIRLKLREIGPGLSAVTKNDLD
jgi:hypothetical protein